MRVGMFLRPVDFDERGLSEIEAGVRTPDAWCFFPPGFRTRRALKGGCSHGSAPTVFLAAARQATLDHRQRTRGRIALNSSVPARSSNSNSTISVDATVTPA